MGVSSAAVLPGVADQVEAPGVTQLVRFVVHVVAAVAPTAMRLLQFAALHPVSYSTVPR